MSLYSCLMIKIIRVASTAKSTNKNKDTYLCHISGFKIGNFTDQLLSTFIK